MMKKEKKDFKMLQKYVQDKEMKLMSNKFSGTSLAPTPLSLPLRRTSSMQWRVLRSRRPS